MNVVVAAVETGGMSRYEAASRYGTGIGTAIRWVQRVRRSGSVAPDKTGGSKPRRLAGAHRDRLIRRCVTHDFTLRGLVGEPGDRGLRADYRSVRTFVHDEKL
ncbi:IS630 family transposase, partial [Acetobacter sp. LMG 1636]|nr:IS630 family transposase [Acetobacter fallax]